MYSDYQMRFARSEVRLKLLQLNFPESVCCVLHHFMFTLLKQLVSPGLALSLHMGECIAVLGRMK